jgi:hypothetical protein
MYPYILFCQANTWIQRNDIGTSIKNGPPYRFELNTYLIKTVDINGKIHLYKGTVLLIR